jgi:hypothetical protein
MASGICMLGAVRSTEVCPSCRKGYKPIIHSVTGDQVDLVCPCGGRPTRFYVDGRGIRDRHGAVGRLFRDPRPEMRFRSPDGFRFFLHAKRILEAIRLEIDDGRFDSRLWGSAGTTAGTENFIS